MKVFFTIALFPKCFCVCANGLFTTQEKSCLNVNSLNLSKLLETFQRTSEPLLLLNLHHTQIGFVILYYIHWHGYFFCYVLFLGVLLFFFFYKCPELLSNGCLLPFIRSTKLHLWACQCFVLHWHDLSSVASHPSHGLQSHYPDMPWPMVQPILANRQSFCFLSLSFIRLTVSPAISSLSIRDGMSPRWDAMHDCCFTYTMVGWCLKAIWF